MATLPGLQRNAFGESYIEITEEFDVQLWTNPVSSTRKTKTKKTTFILISIGRSCLTYSENFIN